jgi:hypothetical protein
MLVISFNTWEDYDKAIATIASAFASMEEVMEDEQECVRCGEWVFPSEHGTIGCDV